VSSSTDERTKIEELKRVLATAVKQSNSIISILDVQQGLLQMVGLKEVGKAASSVKITGVADAATRNALFELSGMIFPKGFNIPDKLWQQYTDAVGIHIESATKTTAGWSAATYVALPQAVASLLIERAGGWIAKHGLSVLAQKLAPVPLQNQELQLRFDKPSVVTVKAPTKREEEIKFDDNDAKKEAAKKARQLAAYRRKKAKEAARKAAEAQAAAAANPTDPKAQQEAQKATTEAAVAEKSAQQSETSAEVATQAAGGQGEGGQAAGGQAAGGQAAGGSVGPISINIPGGGSFTTPGEPAPAPAPTPAPAEPEPVAPIQAGMGSSWLLMSAFGLGALFFLKNDKKNPQRTAVGRR
jgi:pyruvate/2-oxoglutarate dehydrogenase complex dihydrolipoamide acyltransferase (E2) component